MTWVVVLLRAISVEVGEWVVVEEKVGTRVEAGLEVEVKIEAEVEVEVRLCEAPVDVVGAAVVTLVALLVAGSNGVELVAALEGVASKMVPANVGAVVGTEPVLRLLETGALRVLVTVASVVTWSREESASRFD